jgi:hypothetical protein
MLDKPLTLALVPLDERPVNTRYPQMLGAIGGAEVLLPDPSIRGRQRTPADLQAVANWLQDASPKCAAALVSCDYLGYGNLINARISQDSAAEVLSRLQPLEEINAHCPVHAFSLITRVSNADDCVEEPLYWAEWGTKFYRYARLTHQAEQGQLSEADAQALADLQKTLPPDLMADWMTRRLRNHTVNLGLLDLAARGKLASLLITSDDTSAFGFPSRERDWLKGWPKLIGPALAHRVMMHPGADEVGSALVSRILNDQQGWKPSIFPLYSMAGDKEIVAPYEDRPVRETVLGQIEACGCQLAASPEEADIILGVATPSPRRTDYRPEFLVGDKADRTEPYAHFLTELGKWQQSGRAVALADVAYPNGSDPLLTELLLAGDSPLALGQLSAYGAWNTAGNTLGTVIAQASCALRVGDDPARIAAQRAFLAHRFLEDYGYQTVVRREARDEAEKLWGRREPKPNNQLEQATICAFVEYRLGEVFTQLQARGVGQGLRIAPGSVRLPWQRTFEVDFELIPS